MRDRNVFIGKWQFFALNGLMNGWVYHIPDIVVSTSNGTIGGRIRYVLPLWVNAQSISHRLILPTTKWRGDNLVGVALLQANKCRHKNAKERNVYSRLGLFSIKRGT